MSSTVVGACGLAIALLAYVYVLYPVLLSILVRLRGVRPVRRGSGTPTMTLVISAYNEGSVIRRKLENALSLHYPYGLLQIVVISDASADDTDRIVSEYADRGVTLARQPERLGKTAGLNRVVPQLTTELVVFSDANAMYQPDALLKLARNFADPAVGCVTGEARYLPQGHAAADVGERAYWNYEIQLKRLETALGSMVGGDGAIYAIRRALWRDLPPNAINDFLNPLQIVAAGFRAVYEPDAICYEETAGRIRAEYRRRVRIVSRSWRAVFQARGVLNPFRVGLFTWSLLSHKMLRWVSAVFVVAAAVGIADALLTAVTRWPAAAIVIAIAGGVAASTTRGRKLTAVLWYFAVINAASLVGVVKGSIGRVSGVWSTPREQSADATLRTVPVGRLFLTLGMVATGAATVAIASRPWHAVAQWTFWTSTSLLAYVYLGYPAVLALLGALTPRGHRRHTTEPRVCLFITANDEAAVIEAKLHNALALDYPADRLEIVVASDGSVDGTNDIVRRLSPRVRLLDYPVRRGKIATINDGIRSVTSDIIVFSDANTFLDRDAVRALVDNFADPRVGAVSGDVALVGERAALARSEDLYYRYERWLQHAESNIGSMIGADGALYGVRRELFVPPADDTILDDMAIPMAVVRSGHRVVFERAARATEQGSETAREEFNRKSRVVAGAIQFLARRDSDVPVRRVQVVLSLISHKALRWVSPVLAACSLVSSLLLLGASPAYVMAATAQGIVLVIGVAGCIPVFRRVALVAAAHYLCLVQAAAAVGFVRGVTGRQSVMWQRIARDRAVSGAALSHRSW